VVISMMSVPSDLEPDVRSVNAVDHRDMIAASSKTDSSGAFELRLLAGVTYLIRAGVRTNNTFRPTETVVFVGDWAGGLRIPVTR